MEQEKTLATRIDLSKAIERLPVTASTSISVARSNCVGQLSKNGRKIALEAIEVAVALLADFFGVKFSEIQIRETAKLIYGNWYWLDVVEFKIAIDRVKTQHYEKLYGHLTPAYIMDVFQRVSAESWNARDNDSTNDYERMKKIDGKESDEHRKEEREKEEGFHQFQIERQQKKVRDSSPQTNIEEKS